jgi:putative transposase
MANTYTQIHIHCIFAVKYRKAMITKDWKERLHKYITGIVQNNKHKMISINSMPDHLHMLFGMRPDHSLSDLMRLVKGDSSEWINNKKLTPSLFRWQEGYGAFSYSKSQIHKVATYVENQEIHHKKITFLDEYRQFLKKFEVEYDEKYIFKEPE